MFYILVTVVTKI